MVEPPLDRVGETVFADRPLRFRSLTVAEADLSVLEAPEGFHGGFKIRVAKLGGRRREAGKLVERRYTGRGYTIPTSSDDPQLSTFIAYDEGQLVGTVSVRLDSDKGLSADELYRNELDALRSAGCRVCEFTRLAVDKTAASKPVLAGLFHTAYLYASVIRGCTHAVIEVNPRHVVFYGRALRFDPIGEERMNTARQRAGRTALRAVCDHRRRNREICRQARRARRRALALRLRIPAGGRAGRTEAAARTRRRELNFRLSSAEGELESPNSAFGTTRVCGHHHRHRVVENENGSERMTALSARET